MGFELSASIIMPVGLGKPVNCTLREFAIPVAARACRVGSDEASQGVTQRGARPASLSSGGLEEG